MVECFPKLLDLKFPSHRSIGAGKPGPIFYSFEDLEC
jgi:hypothetical protein